MLISLIKQLLAKIEQLQLIMIAVSTEASRHPIREKEKEYTQLYKDIIDLIEFIEEEGVLIENPNSFKSLSTWRDRWYSLSGYASKTGYIHDLYASVFEQIDIILCQHYVKDKSQQELVDEWQISRFKDLKAKIKELQLTMLSVATQGEPVYLIKSEEEGYSQLYREITLQINILREIGVTAPNPNNFRSLWQWYNYWLSELDNSKAVREEYIDNLYESVLKPIDRALKQYPKKLTSTQEFIQYLQRRFNQTTSPSLTPVLRNSVQISTSKVDNNLEQQTSEPVRNSLSIGLTQSVENSLFTSANYTSTWIDEDVMNPEVFLEQDDVVHLEDSLEKLFSIKFDNPTNRRSLFTTSGIDDSFMRNINLNGNPVEVTNIVVGKFKDYKVYNQRLDYHPMVKLLQYLLKRKKSYELEDQDIELFTKLTERGQENFQALTTRNAVCRIESPIGNAIGTGVILKNNFLLTCNHIFSKSQVQKAWVRFGYKAGNYELTKDVFELDFIDKNSVFDYALLKIKEQAQQSKTISVNENSILDSSQEIRIIHHPQGNPVIISDLGQITQVGEDYIDHNVKTDDGSSGAPIFNRQWELIAIHQGNPGIGRTVTPGSTGGIPIRAIWNQISPHLS
ncbi:MAG: trypsin-like peptidase domain-containing protein [Heteroscytonema crispum UTEX LB 1556]